MSNKNSKYNRNRSWCETYKKNQRQRTNKLRAIQREINRARRSARTDDQLERVTIHIHNLEKRMKSM